jgi:hypothetical protein
MWQHDPLAYKKSLSGAVERAFPKRGASSPSLEYLKLPGSALFLIGSLAHFRDCLFLTALAAAAQNAAINPWNGEDLKTLHDQRL